MSDNEMWAAGFLSGIGSFFLRNSKGIKAVTLTIKSRSHPEAVQRFAQIAGTNCIMSDAGMKVTLSGKPLHAFLKRLWDELPVERKKEYAALRKAATPDPWEH